MMFYLATRSTENEKNKISEHLYNKDRRDLFKLIAKSTGLIDQSGPHIESVEEIIGKISELSEEKRRILMDAIDEEIKRGEENPLLGEIVREEPDKLKILFLKKTKYWEVLNKMEKEFEKLKRVDYICKKTDEQMNEEPQIWQIRPDWTGCYETLYRITSWDVHPSTLGASKLVDEHFQTVDFNSIRGKQGLIITLIEHILLGCWLINKEFALNYNVELNDLLNENAKNNQNRIQ